MKKAMSEDRKVLIMLVAAIMIGQLLMVLIVNASAPDAAKSQSRYYKAEKMELASITPHIDRR